ncbi:MAG: DUF5666 domain-containing protein, partial [Gammaproteobacteria bacterium]|nr:DUF5666 domain-containing protein [Gammaproteobacteria bacterium]
ITGFGSVYVSGTKYEVHSGTVIAIEDEAESLGDDSRLRLGMKVRVTATESGGQRSAERFEFDEDLKGPIDSITPDANDPTIGTFVVIDQAVRVDANTIYDNDIGNNDGVAGIDFRDLQLGMIVEVSAFPTPDGFLATRVDRELDAAGGNPDIGDPAVAGDELELKGFVESVASDGSSITIEGVVFIVGTGSIFEDGLLPNSDLIGTFVEVKADIVGGDYVMVRLEREDVFDTGDRVGEIEFEGVLQAVDLGATPNTFTIDGRKIPVNNAAGLEALVGMRVEIKGSFDNNGTLVLREAGRDIEDNVRTEDLVALVDVNSATPNFTTRLGLVITPSGGSGVQDDTGNDGDHLTPGQFVGRLELRDRIEARGRDNGDGSVAWARIRRDELAADNNDFECELRGPVTSKSGDETSFSFVIQGVTVRTDSVSENNFEGANDQPLGRAEFFRQLQTGDVVEAESFEGDQFCIPGELDARVVEFEPGDGS